MLIKYFVLLLQYILLLPERIKMQREISCIIRKIQYGVIPHQNSLVVQTGTRLIGNLKDYVITEIVEDRNTFFEFGYFEYLVYVTRDGDKEQIFWKRFIKPPDMIEYLFPGEDPKFLI